MSTDLFDDVDELLSARGRALAPSAIREVGKLIAGRPDVISFAGGMPSPATFPVGRMRAAFDAVLSREANVALQYGPTDGYAPLRAWIAERLSRDGTPILPEQVMLTSGSQQGLDLIGKILLDEGDAVCVETPTYIGALQGLSLYRPRFVSVPTDEEGLIPDSLAELLPRTREQARCNVLYTIPTFQNPTGRTLSADRRARLAEEAARLKLLIVEDDPYSELDYTGARHQTLLSLYPQGVIHLGSFSKVLTPGIRLGYVVAPLPLARKLEQAKQAADLHTATLTQMVVHETLRDGFLDQHLPLIRQLYRGKCDVMLEGLREHFSAVSTWTKPTGGMFIWLTLTAGLDAGKMLAAAVERGVAFVPGAPFYAEAPQPNTMRLSYVTMPTGKIQTGLALLGALVKENL